MNTLETMAARHSYRGAYLDTPVPREDLLKIMKAGWDAPSGSARSPQGRRAWASAYPV